MPVQPDSIGPYIVIEPLISGGSGVVYRAAHRDTGAQVALKSVRVPHQVMLQSIRREIHALARLHHPDIVRIVEHGVADGLPWYAMEMVRGVTLRAWLQDLLRRSEPEPPGARFLSLILTLICRLCTPLAYLHGEGLVHRDLKPENILVQPDDRPLLIDFGLLLVVGGELSRETLVVEDGVSGTLHYMAPEQIRGGLVDARADLYSLGCIFYELLTGQPPFAGETLSELFRAHLQQEPGPPSRMVPQLPVQLDRLVCRLLTKCRRDRPGYAADVAAALVRLGAEEPDEQDPRPRSYLYRPGFTGRGEQLGALLRHLHRLPQGDGGLVLVAGESGVGKTRLAIELACEAAREQIPVLTGQCRQTGGRPLEAFRRALVEVADHCRERGREETERVLGNTGKVLAAYEPAFRSLPGVETCPDSEEVPLSPEAAVHRLCRCLLQTLAAVTRQEPLLLVVDDLQWADDLALAFLGQVGRGAAAEHLPLLIVGLLRSEEASEQLREVARLEEVVSLDLGHLGKEAVAAMAADMLGVSELPVEFSRLLYRRSDGNPFFVAEHLRTAVEEGLLCREAFGSWQLASKAGRADQLLPIPSSLQELVSRRLQDLSGIASEVVSALAVVGRETSFALVREMTGIGEDELLSVLHELVRRQLLDPEHPERGTCRFLHDQIREAAYQAQSEEHRIRWHGRAAAALNALHASDPEAHAGELAYHYDRARLGGDAAGWYLRAGKRAAAQYAAAESLAHLTRALQLTPENSDTSTVRFEILLLREGVNATLGQRQQQQHDLAALQELAEALPEARGRAEVLLRRARYAQATSDYAETISLSRTAIDLARQAADAGRQAAGYLQWGLALWRFGDLAASGEQLERALALARDSGARRVEADSLRTLGNLLYYQGRFPQAMNHWRQALAISRKLGDRVGEASTLGNLGEGARSLGDYPHALESNHRRLQLCREIGDREGESIALANLSLLSHNLGDHRAAERYARQVLEIALATGHRSLQGYALNNLGHALSGQARQASPEAAANLRHQATDAYQQAAALRQDLGEHFLEMESLAGLARLCLAAADMAPALELTERILWFLQSGNLDGTDEPLRILLTCVEVLDARHDERAGTVLRTAYSMLRERAAGIAGEERRSYLEQVHEHREIVRLVQAGKLPSP